MKVQELFGIKYSTENNYLSFDQNPINNLDKIKDAILEYTITKEMY